MGQFLGRQARAARSQTIGEMNIVWSPEAIEDLAPLRVDIAGDNPAAARRTVRHIIESIEQSQTIRGSAAPDGCRAPERSP